MTERFSTRKMPQSSGISSSFLIMMASVAMIPPMVKLPVSPIKIWAGYALYHKNPPQAPTKAVQKITSSPRLGMYMMLRYWEKITLPDR